MRLSCPNCLTEYDVPDAALAGRSRTLRCAHCNHQWVHGAVPVAPEPAPAPPPVETPVMAPVETPEPVAEAVQDAPAETMAALPPEPVATAPEWRPEMVVLPEPDLVPAHEYPEPDAPPAIEAAPAVTWPATPTLSGWPDFYARTPPEPESEPQPEAEAAAPALPQGFGFPVDEAARDALNDAATAEAAVHDMNVMPVLPPPDAAAAIEPELEPAPEPAAPSLRLLTDEDFRLAAQPKPIEEEPDAFAALVTAARRKSLEYEPDPPPPPPPVRTSSTPLFILLLVLFILGMIGLERHLVIQLIPASAKIFQAIGLK